MAEALNGLGIKAVHFPFALYQDLENEIVRKYEGFTDNPIPLYYKQLDVRYPNSKFILTTRDESDWLSSMKWLFEKGRVKFRWGDQLDEMHEELFGTSVFDERMFLDKFRSHNEEVTRYFSDRSDDLLIMNLKTNFNYYCLCEFLGRKVPEKPFPRRNMADVGIVLTIDLIEERLRISKFGRYLRSSLGKLTKTGKEF